jgi:hypothetical protein
LATGFWHKPLNTDLIEAFLVVIDLFATLPYCNAAITQYRKRMPQPMITKKEISIFICLQADLQVIFLCG